MAVSFYLVPQVGTGTIQDGFRAKYMDQAGPSSAMYLGKEPFFILAINNVDPTLDSTISADATCTKIPALTNTVGAALATVQSKIEGIGIPAGWVTAGMTYQTVLGTVMKICQLYQRLNGLGAGRLLASGVTLDTTFGSLPQGVRTKLLTMAQSFNFDTSSLSGASTIRQILKALADQWVGPILLGGVTF